MDFLARRLAVRAELRELRLDGNALHSAHLAALTKGLANAPHLRVLSLKDNRLQNTWVDGAGSERGRYDGKGARALAGYLRHHKGLKFLDLRRAGFDDRAEGLAESIADGARASSRIRLALPSPCSSRRRHPRSDAAKSQQRSYAAERPAGAHDLQRVDWIDTREGPGVADELIQRDGARSVVLEAKGLNEYRRPASEISARDEARLG